MPAKKRTRAASRRGNGGAGIAERTFQEIRSSLDSLRDLMESYMPVGRAGVKRAPKAPRRRRATAAAAKSASRPKARKNKSRSLRKAAG